MSFSGVHCPFCKNCLQRKSSGKRNWSDDQWYHSRADVTCEIRGIRRNCCSACSDSIGEYYRATVATTASPTAAADEPEREPSPEPQPLPNLQPWTFPAEVTADMFSASWHRLRDMPTKFWTIFHQNVCHYGHEECRHRWIREMYHTCGETTPRSVSPLKFLSKFGAVRVRSSGIPRSGVHWLDKECGMGYIDVSNALYSFVLDWIWPGLPFVNPGTRGDIVEAILGWSFLTQKHGCQPRTKMSNEFILDLDRVLWYVWTHQSSYIF